MKQNDTPEKGPTPTDDSAHIRTKGIVQVWLVIGVLTVGLLVNVILSNTGTVPQVRAAGPAAAKVEIVQPTIGDAQIRLEETGTVQVRNSIELSPQISGRVISANPALASGGHFRSGEILFQIDDSDYISSVERAEADLAATMADLQVEQAEADIARREWALVNPGEPISDIVAREPQLARAKSAVRSAEAALASAQLDLKRVVFSLPFDGRILSTSIEIGQNLVAGQSYGRAYNPNSIEVSVPINATALQGLSPETGASATVRAQQLRLNTSSNRSDTIYTASVSRADAELDSLTRLGRLTLTFNEPVPLLPGEFVEVEIAGPTVRNVYTFPERALQENRVVWVIKDGRLASRRPELIYANNGEVISLPFDSADGIVLTALSDPQEGDSAGQDDSPASGAAK